MPTDPGANLMLPDPQIPDISSCGNKKCQWNLPHLLFPTLSVRVLSHGPFRAIHALRGWGQTSPQPRPESMHEKRASTQHSIVHILPLHALARRGSELFIHGKEHRSTVLLLLLVTLRVFSRLAPASSLLCPHGGRGCRDIVHHLSEKV